LTRYLIQRLMQAVLVIIGVTLVVFFLARLAPGDPVNLMLPEDARPEEREAMRRNLGFDKPLYVQYYVFLRGAVRGDMGRSLYYRRPCVDIIMHYLPNTLLLTASSMFISLIFGMATGIIAALKRDSIWDYGGAFMALFGRSMPAYWLGIMLILIFSVQLRILPTSGIGTLRHLLMPSVTLGAALMGIIMRLTRSGLLDVLNEDYIRTARSKGVGRWLVITRHALKNTFIPLVTVVGLQLGSTLSGSVIVETVFAWPGVGRVLVTAIGARDYPMIQAGVLFVSIIFVFTNLAVDLLYGLIDPRVRYQ
jgi:peptide/nickel transport system permease protein